MIGWLWRVALGWQQCQFRGGGDGGAAAARQAEAERQARIEQGSAAINQQFGGFNDDYFKGVAQAYLGHYLPLLEEQAAEAGKRLPYQFATTQGSAYQGKLGDLQRDIERERANIYDQSTSFANQQRLSVEDARSALLNQLQAGLGVEAAGTQAAARAGALTKPPAFSPIGDLFAKYSGVLANERLAKGAGYGGPQGQDPRANLLFPSGGSTVRTVYS